MHTPRLDHIPVTRLGFPRPLSPEEGKFRRRANLAKPWLRVILTLKFPRRENPSVLSEVMVLRYGIALFQGLFLL